MKKFIFNNLLTVHLCGKFSQKKGWDHNGKIIDKNLLVLITEGDCTFSFLDHSYFLKEGDTLIIPKNTTYYPNTENGCSYLYFWFEAEVEEYTQERLPVTFSFGDRLPKQVELYLNLHNVSDKIAQNY